MEYLVHIVINWPPDGDVELLARLTAAERQRARELAASGIIRRLWRVPGQRANWGVWEAPDATTLHASIASLPLFPYLSVEVHPLAVHPSDPENGGGRSNLAQAAPAPGDDEEEPVEHVVQTA